MRGPWGHAVHGEAMNGAFRWLKEGVLAGGPHLDPFGDPAHLERVLSELEHAGIGAIVSLCELPVELPPASGFEYLHAPTPDGEAPEDLEALCTFIDTERRHGRGTFVHCHAGQGRTGTVLAAWLIWSEGRSARAAIEEVRSSYHPLAVETSPQMGALEAFARRHRLI